MNTLENLLSLLLENTEHFCHDNYLSFSNLEKDIFVVIHCDAYEQKLIQLDITDYLCQTEKFIYLLEPGSITGFLEQYVTSSNHPLFSISFKQVSDEDTLKQRNELIEQLQASSYVELIANILPYLEKENLEQHLNKALILKSNKIKI